MNISIRNKLFNSFRISIKFIGMIQEVTKWYLFKLFSGAILKASRPFINIIMSKYIIDELTGMSRLEVLALYVLVIVLGNGVFGYLSVYFDVLIDIENKKAVEELELRLGRHIVEMKYEYLEDAEILDKKEEVLYGINVHSALSKMTNHIVQLIQVLVTLIGAIFLVSRLSYMLLLMLSLFIVINTITSKKSNEERFKFHKEIAPINRQYSYHYGIASDFSIAKDVRIYDMSEFIGSKITKFNIKSMDIFGNMYRKTRFLEGIRSVNIHTQTIIAYGYSAWHLYRESITIGDFSMYIGLINSFSTNMMLMTSLFSEYVQNCKYLESFLDFEELTSIEENSKGSSCPLESTLIEFKDVWFRYPNHDEYILSGVSITIEKEETLSIVGENGAGKSTFIKLLCRLYEPEKGEILINGQNINTINMEEYRRLLAVIFQDYKLFSFSIKENIVLDKDLDEEQLEDVLRRAGIFSRIQETSDGVDTHLYRTFNESGIEFSGGEMQKIALARTLYKDAPIVVMDEPTSALDPYAEFELYTQFKEMISRKTAIFISHRLSSCTITDKIAVFQKGKIIEYGTFDNLIEKNGQFKRMWDAQSEYYTL